MVSTPPLTGVSATAGSECAAAEIGPLKDGVATTAPSLRSGVAVALAVGAPICAGLAWRLNAVSDRRLHNLDWPVELLLGVVTVWSGVFAWWRRPDVRTGMLLLISGYLIFAGELIRANNAWLFTMGVGLVTLAVGPLTHLIATYPLGRATRPSERAVVGAGYAFVGFVVVSRLVTTDYRVSCELCPINRAYVGGYPGAFHTLNAISIVAGAALSIAVAVLFVQRWRRGGRAMRRTLAPVALSVAFSVAVAVATYSGLDNRNAQSGLRGAATDIAFMTVPIALAFGLIRGRAARAGASDLILNLAAGVEPAEIDIAVARALGDPGAQVVYWRESTGRYIDADGMVFASEDSTRQVTPVERDGRLLAAVVHDPAILNEPERLATVSGAVGLALDHARLTAELRARLVEIQASRARIVAAADAERRRVERNLHDGAQQRLVGVTMLLRTAYRRAEGQPEVADLIAESIRQLDDGLQELRELARGIHPPLLTEKGLMVALDALAERAALPVRVGGNLTVRPAPPAEAAAYYVAAEALTNAVKYSHATLVSVKVESNNGLLSIEVTDDGVGGVEPSRGSGLRGLLDRVEAIGGRLEIDSPVGNGTRVLAMLPLDA